MDRNEIVERTEAFAEEVERFSRPLLDRTTTEDSARQLRRAATGLAGGRMLDVLLDESAQLARIVSASFRTASANQKRRRLRRRRRDQTR